jgi:hypothetical protein
VSGGEGVARRHLPDAVRAAESLGSRQNLQRLDPGPGRHADEPDPHQPLERGQAAGMIRMEVRDENAVERTNTGPRECSAQDAWRWAGIDQQRVTAIAHEDRIALPHVEHLDRRPGADPRSDGEKQCGDAQNSYQRKRAPSRGRRPCHPDTRDRSDRDHEAAHRREPQRYRRVRP